ncbi:MAG: NUDIX domain-containing protein [Oscillospiraceae bacterium]|nr:NUDIX domain-containing protein [Oscillospiraceae bacterium]
MPSFEKSCGAVIFRKNDKITEYLLVLNKKRTSVSGHWGFPKGHVEEGETEHETALREVMEETGLKIEFFGNFRSVTHYSPKTDVMKNVVYFLATVKDDGVSMQESEIADFVWLPFKEAERRITNEGDRRILRRAVDYMHTCKKRSYKRIKKPD